VWCRAHELLGRLDRAELLCEAWQVAETAIVVLVPEADAVVDAHRQRFDPAAAAGVPAHVTVLYPFRQEVDDAVHELVAAVAAGVPPFDIEFRSVARFPGEVVYLAPDPARPFLELMTAMFERFADCPPYGGAFADPVPHLTVADGVDDTTATTLERELRTRLPIRARVERITLLARSGDGTWRVDRHWPLRG
jgi:2'-5' RNA ligase